MKALTRLREEIRRLTRQELAALKYSWNFHGRPEQLPPEGDWQFWSYIAGRGAGKTRSGAEYVRDCIRKGYRRIALVAPTNDDFHKVMVTGESGILSVCPNWDYPEYNENKKTLTWPNGGQAFGYSAEKPNRLRGPQHDCFVSGTLVATATGDRPIEDVRVGDMVWTRAGLRRVTDTRSRIATVGSVFFGNGAALTGTGTHPIYTERGWTPMSDLRDGDQACAIVASNGTANAGIATARGVDRTMSAPTSLFGQNARYGFIGLFGSIIAVPFQLASKFTTSTATWRTTISAIWNACRKDSTVRRIERWSPSRMLIGLRSPTALAIVSTAAVSCSGNSSPIGQLFASRANPNEQSRSGRRSSIACIAGLSFDRGVATIAANVASTWQPTAQARVYCFTVEGEHEYFANGILVHNCAWADEIAAWHGKKNLKPGETSRRQETWDMLMYGLRLGDNPRCFVSTTPLPVDVIRMLIENGLDAEQDAYVITRGSTYANRSNLAERFFESIISKYEGTRLGRQELLGELLLDVPGALWTLDMIAAKRITDETPEAAVERMQRVIVGVDPSGAASMSDESADEIGIVTAGQDSAGEYAVISDDSIKGSPTQWARAAVNAYHKYKADKIVAERNFGGEMVRSVIENVDSSIRVDLVTASRGKAIRAEPIALLYERGEVHHIGILGHLEDQLIRMTPGGYIGDGSPDRLDAAVWALTELSAGATVQHFGVA